MNFLAHFHLAWPDRDLLAGGLEGDYCKGPLRGQLPRNLERGVRLHRAIDAYTDGHPRLLALRAALPPELRRYAGILIDLSFDHYLSRHWEDFSAVPLADFTRTVYRSLQASEGQLSERSRRMLARLVEHDILARYTDWSTVPATAERIGDRFSRGNPFTGIGRRLNPLRADLESAFLEFYPQLCDYSARRAAALA